MKVLFLGGIFDTSHNMEIISKTNTYVEYAANKFQKKIIDGLLACGADISVVSAPFLGAYPMAYQDAFFRGFNNMQDDHSGYRYVNFNNIYGIRNISRARSLMSQLRAFSECEDLKYIIVYSPHTPFLRAAQYVKSKDPRTRICLVVPDLPQYMNLASNIPLHYSLLKAIDIKIFKKLNKYVDSYMLLTEDMKHEVNVENKPYIVVEGIFDGEFGNSAPLGQIVNIAYTGKLNKSFGVLTLVKAFTSIENTNLRLIICGSGEDSHEIEEYARKDSRIDFRGQVDNNEATSVIANSHILVNPRPNDSEYTRYSFPSKIIDYLSTGNIVVAHMLDGMPMEYANFITNIEEDNVESMSIALKKAIDLLSEDNTERILMVKRYFQDCISKEKVAQRLMELWRMTNG